MRHLSAIDFMNAFQWYSRFKGSVHLAKPIAKEVLFHL